MKRIRNLLSPFFNIFAGSRVVNSPILHSTAPVHVFSKRESENCIYSLYVNLFINNGDTEMMQGVTTLYLPSYPAVQFPFVFSAELMGAWNWRFGYSVWTGQEFFHSAVPACAAAQKSSLYTDDATG